MEKVITPTLLQNAMSYKAYRDLIDQLFSENRTTGDFMENSEEVLNYTKMNISRMNRGAKTCRITDELSEALQSISQKYIWLVITEGWCGDAAQSVPVFVKMAELNPNIEIKFVLRDENPKLMDAYLYKGTRSIPKLIILKADTLDEIGTWGPRPSYAQHMTDEYKKNPTGTYMEYAQQLHKWYAKDKYQSVQGELLELIKQLS